MMFKQIAIGQMQNFHYIIGDDKTKEAAIIDAGWESEKLLEEAQKDGFKVKYILLTHTHWDHTKDIEKLLKLTKAKIYVHEAGVEELKTKGIPVISIKDGDEISIGNLKVKVIYTPGHSESNVCFLAENKMIVGDTLFVDGMGRIDLPGSDPKKQFESLQKLKKLDDNIEIYPGHDYGSKPFSTIGYEKKHNPYMQMKNFEDFPH